MKSPNPQWLSPLVLLQDFGGDAPKYLEHIFSLFTKDFIETTPIYRNKKILYDKQDNNGKPAAFVHITTEENRQTGERELCLRRCERIAWIKAIIEHADDSLVLVWEKEQSTSKRRAVRTYLFLEQENFLVILQELKYGHYIVTAIYVDNPNQKRKHLKAYGDFQKKLSV